jgi:hypothetical protein
VNSGPAHPRPRGAPPSYAAGPAPTRRPWPTSPDSVPAGGWPCREEPSHTPIVGHGGYSSGRSGCLVAGEPGTGWATSLRCGSESGPRTWCSASRHPAAANGRVGGVARPRGRRRCCDHTAGVAVSSLSSDRREPERGSPSGPGRQSRHLLNRPMPRTRSGAPSWHDPAAKTLARVDTTGPG